METTIQNLINKYNEGLADPVEVAELEKLIEAGTVDITNLHDLSMLNDRLDKVAMQTPSLALDDSFYAALATEKRKLKPAAQESWMDLFRWSPRLAFSMSLLFLGLIGGYVLSSIRSNPEVKELSHQISEMKEMMMLTMLEKESATERLKAVSLTHDLNASEKVTTALFNVLNHDPSANVRLATLDVLSVYAKNPDVRVRLVESIASQDSPLVQIALAELMVSLNEKSSIEQLRKLMEGNKTPKEVKEKLKESIDVLI